MKRKFSSIINPNTQHLLDLLADKSTHPQIYQDTMYLLGKELANHLPLEGATGNICLACTAEDADFLAKGMLDALENQSNSISLACFWNHRQTIQGASPMPIAPIVSEYIEPLQSVQILVVVKSIISSGCVVKTNLTRLIEDMNPERIIVASPILLQGAQKRLSWEFPQEIFERFEFLYFAEDAEKTETGEVMPGIGGMVYGRLGFEGAEAARSYVPEVVKSRRMRFMVG